MEAPDLKPNIKKLLEDTRKQEEELRKDREALERVARLMGLSNQNGKSTSQHRELPLIPAREPNFSDAIREAVSVQTGQFTIRQIIRFLDEAYPEKQAGKRIPSVSSVLMSLKGKSIKVLKAGKGIPSVYERI